MGQLKPNQPFQTATTLFYTEGNQAAVLVIQTGQGFRKEVVPVGNPQAALDWCLGHGAGLVFSRSIRDPQRN